MVTYINEPFPNAGNKPHLNLIREELADFFKAADIAVRLNNPDRVIKYVDGDYDPPAGGLPDNHCYPCWYNGHGIDIGKLHKGYWMPVKPGWHYGCGEYGTEGLESMDMMMKYYPGNWLPKSKDKEKEWSPDSIIRAQTGKFHFMFYDTPDTLEEWVEKSQEYQAWATKIMTEAFRRDSRMNTFAIHLFIDAFPSGWMKAIMDTERKPKKACFAYREALTPLMVNLRTDRFKYFSGEDVKLEAWICNDKNEIPGNTRIKYMVEKDGEMLFAQSEKADIPRCSSKFQGFIYFKSPQVHNRCKLTVRIGLVDEQDKVLHDSSIDLEVFNKDYILKGKSVVVLGGAKAKILAEELAVNIVELEDADRDTTFLVDDYNLYGQNENKILSKVKNGANLVFLELPSGEYEFGGSKVSIKACGMLPVHFVSGKTRHQLVEGFCESDFRLWFDPKYDYITPLLETTFTAESFLPVLTSANTGLHGQWQVQLAAGEKEMGEGLIRICQIKLSGRISTNPAAFNFAQRLIL
ncbi:MAG: hypothetical protein A2Y21_00580 [Clostridiales bacterium GWC2_40_7]|nr:MAG: hypothetical protein A2Y21_00580 [Clostridiales bacterium GWC2_40_7]